MENIRLGIIVAERKAVYILNQLVCLKKKQNKNALFNIKIILKELFMNYNADRFVWLALSPSISKCMHFYVNQTCCCFDTYSNSSLMSREVILTSQQIIWLRDDMLYEYPDCDSEEEINTVTL